MEWRTHRQAVAVNLAAQARYAALVEGFCAPAASRSLPPRASRATLLAMKLDREQDRPHPLQVALYRQATPTQKLAAVARLNATAIALKESALTNRFPEMPPESRRAETRRWWLTARD